MKVSLKLKIKSSKLLRVGLLLGLVFVFGGFVFINNIEKASAQNVSIKGQVLEPTGDASYVANAYISIQNSNYSVYQSAYTDSQGRFSFLDVPAGSYTLRVDGYNANYPDPLPMAVAVTAGETNDLGQIRLKIPNISGRITDPTEAAGQSNVSVYLSGNGIWDNAATTSQGYFYFYIEAIGAYSLQINPSYSSSYFAPKPDPSFSFSGSNVDLGNIPNPPIPRATAPFHCMLRPALMLWKSKLIILLILIRRLNQLPSRQAARLLWEQSR